MPRPGGKHTPALFDFGGCAPGSPVSFAGGAGGPFGFWGFAPRATYFLHAQKVGKDAHRG